MARVLFIVKDLKMEPLGIMYLSAALKEAGHEVELARCDYGTDPELMVAIWNPDFVAFSVCSGLEDFYFDIVQRLFPLPRQSPNQIAEQTIWGGPSVTFTPEQYRGLLKIRGEGEEAVVDVVEGRVPKQLQLVDVNVIPDADREIAYQFEDLCENPIKNVISRRGCHYSCSYCFNREWNRLHRGQLPKGVVRHRTPEAVVSECARIKANWPVKMINFVDDNFVTSVEWLEKFSQAYSERVGLPFFCSVRPDDVDDYKMKLIAEAGGASINMAVESANDENRRKVLTRTGTKDAVHRTVGLVRKYGMRSRLQNIVGLPVDDPLSDAYETLDFNIDVQPSSSWCAILQAYCGTKIYDIAYCGGYIDPNSTGSRVDVEFFGHSMLEICDKQKIERLHKIWHIVVRWPGLRWLVPIVVRLPIPFSWFKWFFKKTKRYLAEREFWGVFGGKS